MPIQKKNLIRIVAAGAFFAFLGGCAQSRYSSTGPWEWTPPARLEMGNAEHAGSGTNAGSSSAVIVAPGQTNGQFFGYAQGYAPEYDRRDASLNIIESDPYAGYLGFPERERTSLEDQRSFYTSRSAERYTYPSAGRRQYNNRRYNSNRSGHRHR